MVLFGNKKVTVYNRHFDNIEETEVWIPTLLKNVNLVVTKNNNIEKSGVDSADTARLFVDDKCSDKEYLQPKAYKSLSLEEKENYYTFQSDDTTPDFYVEGDTTDVEIMEEGFYEWMLNHYDNVFHITAVDVYKDVMPHMEIGGK